MRRSRAWILAAAVAATASGCDRIGVPHVDNSFITQHYVRNNYSYSLLMRATTGRALPVRVVGQPFPGLGPLDLAHAVVADMPTGFLNNGSYMLDPGGITGIGFRMVWNFDPDPRGSQEDLCASRTGGFARRTAAAPGTTIEVQAAVALCQEDGAYVANYGHVDASGPDDPRFAAFVKQMTLSTLLSPPTEDSGGLGWRF
jgi:hypothetical protein